MQRNQQAKSRRTEKRHAVLGQKKAEVTILASDQVKNVSSDKDHFEMVKVLIHPKHITILNTDALSNRVSKYMKQTLLERARRNIQIHN